jgi:hypothetical protein
VRQKELPHTRNTPRNNRGVLSAAPVFMKKFYTQKLFHFLQQLFCLLGKRYLLVVFIFFNTVAYNDQIIKDEIGGACSMNGGEDECI